MGDVSAVANLARERLGLYDVALEPLWIADAAGMLVCSMSDGRSARYDRPSETLFYDPSLRGWEEAAADIACSALLRAKGVRDTTQNRRQLAQLLMNAVEHSEEHHKLQA